MKINKFLSAMAITLALFSTSAIVKAQTTPASAPAPYGVTYFMKTLPNMNESFLIDMKTRKKISNARVANKTLNSWQLFRTVYGSSMDYNYFTLSVYPSGKEMTENSDSAMKDMSVQEISSFYSSINNTRTIVANDLLTYKMGVGAKMLPGEYVQINSVNVKKGSGAAYIKLVESYKPVMEECIKAGKIKGFNVWARTYATNVNGEIDYFVSYSFATLDQALSWASGKTGPTDEYKKIYPKDDIDNFTAKVNELRDVVSSGLFELVDITD
jgi:hypothetical protein